MSPPTSRIVAVGLAAAAALAGDDPKRTHLAVRNADAANAAVLGGPTVTAASGLTLLAGQTLILDNWKVSLYAIASGGAVNVEVLEASA